MALTALELTENHIVFEGLSLDNIQRIIDNNYIDNPLTLWNNDEGLRDRAVELLTLHILRIERADHFEQSATLKSIKENEEIKIPRLDLNAPYYKQTIYGQEFYRLKRSLDGGTSRLNKC